MKDDLFYIENILQSRSRIQLYISSKDYATFVGDFIVQDAVVRQLEIIGKATKKITKDFRNNNPEIPWADMAGMRDILIHDYIDVDLDIVWKTASESIPKLKALLEKLV
ncbi:MAG TPA: DUF86 domain-containing protein [Bacteroidales bacterium]|nr:DUF86 domain-containing protein [Bacteroidales bacterium]HPJ60228.1 DUF86 domain-containing protein [Bacteroidales bacterium]HPR13449.1 DUF86 domain-containing protein [Bacteroidales bacterium]HRW86393.1 DUF86 domain-containing protein [Bacteroidales bacterium]